MLEQMYQDFTTKLLPTIQQGLVISKDYFMDLFGRYVKYLIVVDSVALVRGLVLMIVGVVFIVKLYDGEDTNPVVMAPFFCFVIGTVMFFENLNYLIKDIYIPEIRVYEELKSFNK